MTNTNLSAAVDGLAKYFDRALKISEVIETPQSPSVSSNSKIEPSNELPSKKSVILNSNGKQSSDSDSSSEDSDYSTGNGKGTSESGCSSESSFSSESGSSSEDSDSSSSSGSETSESEYSSDDDEEEKKNIKESAMKKYAPVPKLVTKKTNLMTGLMESWSKKSILKLFERASIYNGREILLDFNFNLDKINITQLVKAIKEKISQRKKESQMALTKACLVQTEELVCLRQFASQLLNENSKLKADNKDVQMHNSLLQAKLNKRPDNLIWNSKLCLPNNRAGFSSHNGKLELKPKLGQQKEVKPKANFSSLNKWKEVQDIEQKLKKEMALLLENSKSQKKFLKAENIEQKEQNEKGLKSTAMKRRRDLPSQIEEVPQVLKIRKYASKYNKKHQ